MFDFDEIEQVDPEFLPGDWVQARSLGEQGVVTSFCSDAGSYKVLFVSWREEQVQRCDLEKLGERERFASLAACLLAASLDCPLFMEEAERIQSESSSLAQFVERRQALTARLGAVYSLHKVTEKRFAQLVGTYVSSDEALAHSMARLGLLNDLLASLAPTNMGAPSTPTLTSTLTVGEQKKDKRRWVVVTPTGDICSRLRAMISACMLAVDLDRQLLVDWRQRPGECEFGLEDLFTLEEAWFRLPSPDLIRQETALHWVSKLGDLWCAVLASTCQEKEAALKAFDDCHKKAFRKHLAFQLFPSSPKWQQLPRLQGWSFEYLPDFLKVDCISVRSGNWFYPPRPADEEGIGVERSCWLLQALDSAHFEVHRLPPAVVCVHAAQAGTQRSPEHLFVREMDARKARSKGGFLLVTDQPFLEEALRQRYGPLLLLPPWAGQARVGRPAPSTLAAAREALQSVRLLAQGDEILGTYASALSELASLIASAELVVVDADAAEGHFHARDGRAALAGDASEEAEVAARDPSESLGFHLCGSWDGWSSFTKLSARPDSGELVARVMLRQSAKVEEFYVVKDSDPKQRYYAPVGAGRHVMGPDRFQGHGWRVRVPQNAQWLEVTWQTSGGACSLSYRILGAGDLELDEAPEPGLSAADLAGPFFLVGSWDAWSAFHEMHLVTGARDHFFAVVPLRQPVQPEEFQITIGHGWGRRLHPARGTDAILGPDDSCTGLNWRVLPPAHCKWLGVHWNPSKRSLRWECCELKAGPASPLVPAGRYYLTGSWDKWSSYTHLIPEATSNPQMRARIKVWHAPVAVQFQVVLDCDWQQRFWRSRRGDEILGPGDGEGPSWTANVPGGHRWVEVTWDPRGSRSLQYTIVGLASNLSSGELLHNVDASIRAAEYTRLAEEERLRQSERLSAGLSSALADVELCIPQVYRYHCDGLNDAGWGCVYRNTQTIMEALGHDAPTLAELTLNMGTGDEWVWKPGHDCAWAEPHDVADYLTKHAKFCSATHLLLVGSRQPLDLENEDQVRKTSWVGSQFQYEVLDRPLDVLPESREAKQHALAVRRMVVPQLLRARTPVLLDDKEAAFLVVGFRHHSEQGPQYRILDPHYGQLYSQRGPRQFDPALGPYQFGPDAAKDQWVSARWVEEGIGLLNGYNPNPSWMMLLVN